MFTNTIEFSPAAQHFIKHGCYTFEPVGSIAYDRYWDEEERRCIEGYTVNGVSITGPHYFYLNYCPIRRTSQEEVAKATKKEKKKAKKVLSFPDFWDGDFDYYQFTEQAEEDGQHVIVLKTRRRGYSYKNASKALHKYLFFRDSMVLIAAFERKYLLGPRGTMTMVNSYLNFIDSNTAWCYRRDEVNKVDHKKASYEINIDGSVKRGGRNSQIVAISFKDNPDAARGQDFDLVLMEEAGAWPNLIESFSATRPCVEDGDFTIGQILVFGTGGDMESGTAGFASMFYEPTTYNFKTCENIWDEGAANTYCGYFVPDYVNKVGFIDKDGNSDKEGAKASQEIIRNAKKKSSNPSALSRWVTEYPFCPSEATATTNNNIFPVYDLLVRQKQVMGNPTLYNFGTVGVFEREQGKLKFKPTTDIKPIYDWPIKKDVDTTGAVVMYYPPYKVNGVIPDNLYYIGHDPYAQDGEGNSLGATYVFINPNRFVKPDDVIVASYIGRPKSQDEYNKILFDLSEYYNAKIGFENERGEVVPYAKRFRKLHQLTVEFEMPANKELHSIRNRGYGMHMTTTRKAQGEIYIRDWLNEVVYIDADNNPHTRVEFIYDLGLLIELINYNSKRGNFDRVMAIMVAMYHKLELYGVTVEDPTEKNPIHDYFEENYC